MAQASSSSAQARGAGQDSKRTKTVSKAMSYLLRHHAEKAGIDIGADGYVRMSDLLAWQRISKLRATREEIHQVVQDNDKKRFHITTKDGEEYIRAAQGHSIEVRNGSVWC